MDTLNNIKIFELRAYNFPQPKTYPILWIEIKESNEVGDEVLLNIPYTPLVHIKSFQDAIYKQKIPLIGSQTESILRLIKCFYNDNTAIFSNTFLKKIKEIDDGNTTIQLNISYNFNENFTYSHLYFLQFLLNIFQLISVDKDKMIISTKKNELLKNYRDCD